MTSSLERKIRIAREMPKHLAALTEYAGRAIAQGDLLSVEETARIQQQLRFRGEVSKVTRRLSFDDRLGLVFARFIRALCAANSGPVQVWIKTTSDCGLLVLPSVADFNVAFDYETDANGVVTLRTADLENELLLDYFEEHGQRLLEVETSGPDWRPHVFELDS
ncbi:MAG: hypothetical protein RL385_2237 [Pseudomonadota bacterium]|jgi:hypothetical protein